MKRYTFAFGGVQRVRRVAEQQSKAAVAEAQRTADAASAQLHARLEEIGAAVPAAGARPANEFLADREHLDRHRMAVTAARAAELNALEQLAAVHEEWVAAARDLRSIDRLDERKREEWILESARAAQITTDEIAAVRHATRPDFGGGAR